MTDYWDRTEAQNRQALHSHTLTWFKKRPMQPDYKPIPPICRTTTGSQQRQRPTGQTVPPLGEHQEDNVYQQAWVARVSGEMVRPCVNGDAWGGYDVERLRVAGLARAIQMRLPYLHRCTPSYCQKDRCTCRFFFPWPEQPYQAFDYNTERVALKRTLQEDDPWVVPHNLYLTMFSPSSVNVLCFDPLHGADQARGYAAKYCSKPEPYYHLETESNAVKDWIRCRTVGLPMVFNNLLGFHNVRSTRPAEYLPTTFVPAEDSRQLRDPSHLQKYPDFPDPRFYLNRSQTYLFRHPDLRHLRAEQFFRYFAWAGDGPAAHESTVDDTISDEEFEAVPDKAHRHYDPAMERVAPGTRFSSTCKHIEGCRRRNNHCLGVNRTSLIEPIGGKRELFYEQKLWLGLAWVGGKPTVKDDGTVVWQFRWEPPPEDDVGARLEPIVIRSDSGDSFEERCATIEAVFCDRELDAVCSCCALEMSAGRCTACSDAIGWHRCLNPSSTQRLYWRKGTLHEGNLDAQKVLYNLHRRLLPLGVLKEKAQVYVSDGLLRVGEADAIVRTIEQERNYARVVNDVSEAAVANNGQALVTDRLSFDQLRQLLADRESMMRDGGTTATPTDQWRVYQHIISSIQRGQLLRLMVQASAGTGKSFLLSAVYLWCIVNGLKTKAAAPTGIAAANIEIEGTDVTAITIHNMFEMGADYKSKLDFTKLSNSKVAALVMMQALLIDEAGMLDADCWIEIQKLLSLIDHSRRPDTDMFDQYGAQHLILFGDRRACVSFHLALTCDSCKSSYSS